MKTTLFALFVGLLMVGCEDATSGSALRTGYHKRLLNEGIINEEHFSAIEKQEQSPQASEAKALIKEYQDKYDKIVEAERREREAKRKKAEETARKKEQ